MPSHVFQSEINRKIAKKKVEGVNDELPNQLKLRKTNQEIWILQNLASSKSRFFKIWIWLEMFFEVGFFRREALVLLFSQNLAEKKWKLVAVSPFSATT